MTFHTQGSLERLQNVENKHSKEMLLEISKLSGAFGVSETTEDRFRLWNRDTGSWQNHKVSVFYLFCLNYTIWTGTVNWKWKGFR